MPQDNPFSVETNVLDPDYSTATPEQTTTAVTNTLIETDQLDTLEPICRTVTRAFLNANQNLDTDDQYNITHLLLIITQNGDTIEVLQNRITSDTLKEELDDIEAMNENHLDPLSRRVLQYVQQPTMERFNTQFHDELDQLTT